ncbi:hypothetical protein NL676_010326 [Syzygium grande]|nr:hypothetical protein NL676_010326 [Syzygium grande]
MVRCMAAIYCWLRRTTSMDPKKIRSLMLSGSSTKVTLPQCGSREQQLCSSKSTVEISRLTTDKGQLSHAAYAINNYRILVEQLEKVNVGQMEDNAQTAFWINIYNSLVMHAYLTYGIPRSSLRRLALFHKAAYNIGGTIISASALEQSIFCFRTPRIGRWLETVVSAALRKRSGEERQMISSKYGCTTSQPLICFALCNGAASDPVLKVYTGSNLKAELEVARREFLQANVSVKKSKVFLPKVLEKFAKEASISTDDLLSWVIQNVDKKLQDMIQKCIDRKTNRKASQIIEWVPYSSRFQYIFSKDLTEKPCVYTGQDHQTMNTLTIKLPSLLFTDIIQLRRVLQEAGEEDCRILSFLKRYLKLVEQELILPDDSHDSALLLLLVYKFTSS